MTDDEAQASREIGALTKMLDIWADAFEMNSGHLAAACMVVLHARFREDGASPDTATTLLHSAIDMVTDVAHEVMSEQSQAHH